MKSIYQGGIYHDHINLLPHCYHLYLSKILDIQLINSIVIFLAHRHFHSKFYLQKGWMNTYIHMNVYIYIYLHIYTLLNTHLHKYLLQLFFHISIFLHIHMIHSHINNVSIFTLETGVFHIRNCV